MSIQMLAIPANHRRSPDPPPSAITQDRTSSETEFDTIYSLYGTAEEDDTEDTSATNSWSNSEDINTESQPKTSVLKNEYRTSFFMSSRHNTVDLMDANVIPYAGIDEQKSMPFLGSSNGWHSSTSTYTPNPRDTLAASSTLASTVFDPGHSQQFPLQDEPPPSPTCASEESATGRASTSTHGRKSYADHEYVVRPPRRSSIKSNGPSPSRSMPSLNIIGTTDHQPPPIPVQTPPSHSLSRPRSTPSLEKALLTPPPIPYTPPKVKPKHPISAQLSSPSSKSLVPSEGEEPDAFHVRNTYAQLEVYGVKGDGHVEGVERTRARIGASRASQLYAEGALGDGSEKTQDLSMNELELLASLDR